MTEAEGNEEKVILGPWVTWVQRHARPMAFACLALTVLAGAYSVTHLGVNSDNPRMMAKTIPARIHYEAFVEIFPNLENALLVVIDGETPEIARDAAKQLAASLRESPDLFHDVDLPGAGDFFERHGLLYQPLDDLEILSEQIVTVQPILASLEREPTLGNLVSLMEEGLEATEGPLDTPDEWSRVLDRFSEATVKVYSEYPIAISWEDLTLEGSPVEAETRYTLIADPVMDFSSLFSAARPIQEIRDRAKALGLDPEHGVLVRITGHPALNDEELNGLIHDVLFGILLFFGLVLFVLYRALSSVGMVIAALITLVCGLVWTSAFAAFAVKELSLASVTFAIFFIGLGVDFTIHMGMAFTSALRSGLSNEDAMHEATQAVGNSFLLCTLTTSMGFFVFIPTENVALAELGLISGTGMIINLIVTVTLFPALLAGWIRLDGKRIPQVDFHHDAWWRHMLNHNPGRVASVSFVLFALALAATTRTTFDGNVLNLRDPAAESVQAFEDLVEESGERSPWPINAVAADLEAAEALARKVETLDLVESAVHLGDYVPEDQEDKLDILADLGFLLDAPPPPLHAPTPKTPEEQIASLRAFRDYLGTAAPERAGSSMGQSMRLLEARLSEFLEHADTEPEQVTDLLESLESVLLSGVPELFERLRLATAVEPVTLDGLPPTLTRRMLAEDGRARVQIFPRGELSGDDAFVGFANQVTEMIPTASGVAVNLIALADASRSSFKQAILSALALISAALFLVWRRLMPVLLVLTALTMIAVGTVGCMAMLGMPLTLLNTLAIPLLLGIGVDSGIHLVHRAEHPVRAHEELLETTTARAVFFSALTTVMSFGTLGFSSHRGISALGVALTLGMGFIVLCNLVVLPALLALRERRRAAASSR